MIRRVALLGGSFDPVHHGHVALGARFNDLLQPDQLRVIPAGCPWQKGALRSAPAQRAEMLRLAFADAGLDITLDLQELERASPTYTVDTLRNLRSELGEDASIAFLMGADQLLALDSWREWQELFALAHLCVAARPGFTLAEAALPAAVAAQFMRRLGTPDSVRNSASGYTMLVPDLAVDISATEVRAALQRGQSANALIAPVVLDYIEQHNLYKN